MQDDYDAILAYLNNYKTLHGMDKLWELFAQHGEHRILSSRIVYVLYNSLFGAIDFTHIIYLGNLQLIFVYILCIHFIRKAIPRQWFMGSLVAGFCLFDLNNWENADFAMACMQNYGVVLWLFLAIYLYGKSGKAWILPALFIQVLAIYSSGNGMIAMGFVVIYNLLRRDWLRGAVSGLALMVCAPLYFVHYVAPPTGHPSTDVVKVATYFLNVVSAHASFEGQALHIIVGIASVAVFLMVLPVGRRLQIKKEALSLLCISGFIWASMLVAAIFRSNVAGVTPFSSRYMIYPNTLLILIFVFVLYKLKDRKAVTAIAVLFLAGVLCVYNMNMRGGRDGFNAFYKAKMDIKPFYPDTTIAQHILDASCVNGVYCTYRNARL